jgi:hypothetical protein
VIAQGDWRVWPDSTSMWRGRSSILGGGLIEAACARIVNLCAEIDFDSVVFLRTGWLEGCLYRTLYGGG